MAGTAPRLPEQFRSASSHRDDFQVSELVSNAVGAHRPFGEDVPVPMPVHKLAYRHPRRADRPRLAGEY